MAQPSASEPLFDPLQGSVLGHRLGSDAAHVLEARSEARSSRQLLGLREYTLPAPIVCAGLEARATLLFVLGRLAGARFDLASPRRTGGPARRHLLDAVGRWCQAPLDRTDEGYYEASVGRLRVSLDLLDLRLRVEDIEGIEDIEDIEE